MAVATLSCLPVKGQEKVVPFKYGNMDHWVIRNIKESGIIGGNQKKVYAVGPNMTINGNIPYTNKGGSPWGSSNVLAHVSGIYKTNNSVFRDKHGSGYCAKLVTHIEKVKVLGLINIKVLAAGSLFLGDVREPITSTKDGPKAINWGIPFTARPKALRFDYKTSFPNAANRIKQNGFSGFGWRHLQCLQIMVERFLAGRVVEIGVFAHEILIEDVMLIVFVETLYQKGHILFLLGTEFFGVI